MILDRCDPAYPSGPHYFFQVAIKTHSFKFGSSTDPSLNGHLNYPNDIVRSLNQDVTDKIRKYRGDLNNNPHHRETDRFFGTSGVQLVVLV
jgi:hypothetical protein